MSLLTRDQILTAPDLKTEDVDVPEWGGTVRCRTMTGLDRDAFGATLDVDAAGNVDMANYRAKLVAACVVDEGNSRMFSEADATALGEKSAVALARVFTVAERLNGMSSDAVEGAEKNSDAAPSGDSISVSA